MSRFYRNDEEKRGYTDRQEAGRFNCYPYTESHEYLEGWKERDRDEIHERNRQEERREEAAEQERQEYRRRREREREQEEFEQLEEERQQQAPP